MIHKLIAAQKDYIWGGLNLVKEFNKKTSFSRLAESWELSTHKDGECKLLKENCTLNEYIQKNNEVLGNQVKEVPFLIKLIDAAKDLSIQVHPDDVFARTYENDNGKTETWYIVEASSDAYLYYGFNKDCTKEEVKKALENNTILELLNKVPIKKGEIYHLEPGTVHAICANTLIYEIQQTSNVTYRLYDYGRVDDFGKQRELHIEKSLDVMNYQKSENKMIKEIESTPDYNLFLLAETDYYHAQLLELKKAYKMQVTSVSFLHMLVIEGSFKVDGQLYQKGDSLFVDSEETCYFLEGEGKVIIASL